MLTGSDPLVAVLATDVRLAHAVAATFPGSASVEHCATPLELIAVCRTRKVFFAVVQLGYDQHTWLTALEVLQELPESPRVLFLVEPGVLEDVLGGLFRSGTDHMVLWPAEPASLHAALVRMAGPGGPPAPLMPGTWLPAARPSSHG